MVIRNTRAMIARGKIAAPIKQSILDISRDRFIALTCNVRVSVLSGKCSKKKKKKKERKKFTQKLPGKTLLLITSQFVIAVSNAYATQNSEHYLED